MMAGVGGSGYSPLACWYSNRRLDPAIALGIKILEESGVCWKLEVLDGLLMTVNEIFTEVTTPRKSVLTVNRALLTLRMKGIAGFFVLAVIGVMERVIRDSVGL